MPDPTLSAAIKEAYASAPVDQVIYHTLEIWHPLFSVPIRVVSNATDISAKIEAGAPRDAGATVTFVGYAFTLVLPEQTTSAVPSCAIEIDNVDRSIVAAIDAVITDSRPITVMYRAYLSFDLAIGPENLPVLTMTMLTCNATPFRIRASAGFPDLLNKKFPNVDYELETFPGLAA